MVKGSDNMTPRKYSTLIFQYPPPPLLLRFFLNSPPPTFTFLIKLKMKVVSQHASQLCTVYKNQFIFLFFSAQHCDFFRHSSSCITSWCFWTLWIILEFWIYIYMTKLSTCKKNHSGQSRVCLSRKPPSFFSLKIMG